MKISQTVTELLSLPECLEKKQAKGHNSETKRVEAIILVCDMSPDVIHISIKMHEDIPNGY